MMPKSGDRLPPPASLARRRFMEIAAAGAARLSIVVVPSGVLANKCAHTMGMRDDPDHDRDHDHHHRDHGDGHDCFKRGTLILYSDDPR